MSKWIYLAISALVMTSHVSLRCWSSKSNYVISLWCNLVTHHNANLIMKSSYLHDDFIMKFPNTVTWESQSNFIVMSLGDTSQRNSHSDVTKDSWNNVYFRLIIIRMKYITFGFIVATETRVAYWRESDVISTSCTVEIVSIFCTSCLYNFILNMHNYEISILCFLLNFWAPVSFL